jgi:hypothetical protein
MIPCYSRGMTDAIKVTDLLEALREAATRHSWCSQAEQAFTDVTGLALAERGYPCLCRDCQAGLEVPRFTLAEDQGGGAAPAWDSSVSTWTVTEALISAYRDAVTNCSGSMSRTMEGCCNAPHTAAQIQELADALPMPKIDLWEAVNAS